MEDADLSGLMHLRSRLVN